MYEEWDVRAPETRYDHWLNFNVHQQIQSLHSDNNTKDQYAESHTL